IFVIYSLYLCGDAFYRWDGFKFYASFSEFIPSIALITVLWSIIAVFTAAVIWLFYEVIKQLFKIIGLSIHVEDLLMFIAFFVLLSAMIYVGRGQIMKYIEMTYKVKLLFFLCVSLLVTFLSWLVRNKSERLVGAVLERISPLVWLFGMIALFSVPLVVYHSWGNQTSGTIKKSLDLHVVEKNRSNIILVTFDALTALDMSAFGYERDTTPFINEWSRKAAVFTKTQAASNFTTPTTASLMTGKRVWTHQTFYVRTNPPKKVDVESLPFVLKDNGYYTMSFIANPAASVEILGIAKEFDIKYSPHIFWDNAELFGYLESFLYRFFGEKIKLYDWIIKKDFIFFKLITKIARDSAKNHAPPENVFNKFLEDLDADIPEPFFAWIHLWPPHDPYLPMEPYVGIFDSSSDLRTTKTQYNARHNDLYSNKTVNTFRTVPYLDKTVNTFRARYDEYIKYGDKQFEEFIAQLRQRDIQEKTVVILSSDHGEIFNRWFISHGLTLFEPETNIPLIIMEPDKGKGQIVNEVVEQIDIAPTILDLAEITVPSWMEGRSLVPLLRGEMLTPKPIFSMDFQRNKSRGHKITKGIIAVWEDNYKLLHYLDNKTSQLFDLEKDPDEQNNLFDIEQGVGERLLSIIKENLAKANDKILSAKD
ncbi:MAG: sulfatase family protein, partial [Promethearchaeota archaeon]